MATTDTVLEETRKFNAGLEQLRATQPSVAEVGAAAVRAARAEGRGVFGPVVVVPEGGDRAITGRGGRIGLRVFVPDQVEGVYLHIHGGGWALGAANQQDVRLWSIATEARVAVVSVDY